MVKITYVPTRYKSYVYPIYAKNLKGPQDLGAEQTKTNTIYVGIHMITEEKHVRALVREYYKALKGSEPLPGGIYVKINKSLKKNLNIFDNKVYSYDSHVADIEPVTKFLFVKPEFVNFSATTNGHLKDVAKYYDLKFFGENIFSQSKLPRRSRFSY